MSFEVAQKVCRLACHHTISALRSGLKLNACRKIGVNLIAKKVLEGLRVPDRSGASLEVEPKLESMRVKKLAPPTSM